MDYSLHCKLIDGDAFAFEFVGYEDLSDVLEDVERLSVECGLPPMPDQCSQWGVVSADGLEMAAMRV